MHRTNLRSLPFFAGAFALGCALLVGASQPGASAAAGQSVDSKGFVFAPPAITVAEGDTVTWTNSDPVPHTVTSDTGAFDSGVMNNGQTFGFTFTAAGSYSYFCDLHPTMKGTVAVTAVAPAPEAPAPEAQPPAPSEAEPPATPEGEPPAEGESAG